METRLTQNFTLDEFIESDTATRMGINNHPAPGIVDNLKKTALLAETIRATLSQEAGHDVPIIVTSGYRCEALERILCAKDYGAWCKRRSLGHTAETWNTYFSTKAHPHGRAMDFRAHSFGTPFHIVRILSKHAELTAQIDQMILEGVTQTAEGWVHVGWADYPRHQIMTAQFDADGVPHYTNQLT